MEKESAGRDAGRLLLFCWDEQRVSVSESQL
jgi:hypothetical protein